MIKIDKKIDKPLILLTCKVNNRTNSKKLFTGKKAF